MLEEVQLPLDIHPDPHRPRDQPAFSVDEVIVRERRRVRLTERPVSERDVVFVNRGFGLIGHRESRSSTENLLYGPHRALVKIDAHAFRRVQAVMDAVRNTYTPVSRARQEEDRKSTRLNSSHSQISYAVFCLKKKKNTNKKSE